ncbi:hypothetical protein ACIG5E_20900 [Kitasatospora sp. NPDC053057]
MRQFHKLQQRLKGLLHLGEPCQTSTGTRAVTVVVTSPELG